MWKLTVEQGYKETRFNVRDISDIQDIILLFDESGEGDFEYKIYKTQEEKGEEADSE